MSRELLPGGGVGRGGASSEEEALVVAERAGEIEATWGVRIDAGGGRAAMLSESWRSLTGRAGFSRWAGFSRTEAGFFRLALFREILRELFVDLGGN
jgi:hypothetical protein